MAPEIEKIILPAPELNLNRTGQIVPLVIEKDRAVTVVNFLALAQVDHTKIVRKDVGIFLESKPESQDAVEALLESASGAECFLVFSEDGAFAFETGTNQIFLD